MFDTFHTLISWLFDRSNQYCRDIQYKRLLFFFHFNMAPLKITADVFEEWLKYDKDHRHAGVSDGLLTEIPKLVWDFPVPTLCHMLKHPLKDNATAEQAEEPWPTATLAQELCEQYPGLSVLLEDPCVLVAGGCVQAALLDTKNNDVDIFLVGLPSVEAANAKLEELSHKLVACWAASGRNFHPYDDDNDLALLTSNTLTLRGPWECQFILRLYKTVEEVLFGFDLPCCSIGVTCNKSDKSSAFEKDKKEPRTFLTPLCALAVDAGVCVVRPDRASPNFLQRINKYFRRHYHMALVEAQPFVDAAFETPPTKQAKQKNSAVTSNIEGFLANQLRVVYSKDASQPNKLVCHHMGKHAADALADNDVHDYETSAYQRVVWKHYSLLNLAQPENTSHPFPVMYKCGLSGTFSMSLLRPALTDKQLDGLVTMFVSTLQRSNDRLSRHASKTVFQVMLRMYPRQCTDMLLAEDKNACVRLALSMLDTLHFSLARIPKVPQVHWVTENPGDQHTASFKPRPMTPEDLYSSLFNQK
jgi:hypothetical protein